MRSPLKLVDVNAELPSKVKIALAALDEPPEAPPTGSSPGTQYVITSADFEKFKDTLVGKPLTMAYPPVDHVVSVDTPGEMEITVSAPAFGVVTAAYAQQVQDHESLPDGNYAIIECDVWGEKYPIPASILRSEIADLGASWEISPSNPIGFTPDDNGIVYLGAPGNECEFTGVTVLYKDYAAYQDKTQVLAARGIIEGAFSGTTSWSDGHYHTFDGAGGKTYEHIIGVDATPGHAHKYTLRIEGSTVVGDFSVEMDESTGNMHTHAFELELGLPSRSDTGNPIQAKYSGPGDDGLPERIQKLSERKRRVWVAAFNNAWDNYDPEKHGDSREGYAFRVANAAINKLDGAADDKSLEERRKEQQARSRKYGIGILKKGSRLTIPKRYADQGATVEDFADRVNLKYLVWLTKSKDSITDEQLAQVRNAPARFGAFGKVYPSADRSKVAARIAQALKKFGIADDAKAAASAIQDILVAGGDTMSDEPLETPKPKEDDDSLQFTALDKKKLEGTLMTLEAARDATQARIDSLGELLAQVAGKRIRAGVDDTPSVEDLAASCLRVRESLSSMVEGADEMSFEELATAVVTALSEERQQREQQQKLAASSALVSKITGAPTEGEERQKLIQYVTVLRDGGVGDDEIVAMLSKPTEEGGSVGLAASAATASSDDDNADDSGEDEQIVLQMVEGARRAVPRYSKI